MAMVADGAKYGLQKAAVPGAAGSHYIASGATFEDM